VQALGVPRSPVNESRVATRINRAEDHLCLGEVGAAESILTEAAERLRTGAFDSHLRKWQMRVGLMFARLLLIRRDLDRADTHLTEEVRIAERTESRRHVAEGYRIRGEIWLAAGRTEDAVRELRRALDVVWETAGALGRAIGPPRGGGPRRLSPGARCAAWGSRGFPVPS
jgi:tetratricopeptide (TPR) repeat protein